MRRDTGEFIAWERGHLDKVTLKKLLSKLSQWKPVKLYFTDNWHPYKAVISPNLLIQSFSDRRRRKTKHHYSVINPASVLLPRPYCEVLVDDLHPVHLAKKHALFS